MALHAINLAIKNIHRVSPFHVVSLDAVKAFDKMWRDGLFYKLMHKIDVFMWRLLYIYYKQSYVIVNIDGVRSEKIKTSEGVKQGGVLSPHLFNFFMNDLLEQGCALNVDALLGKVNVSILAYCDDIIFTVCASGNLNLILKNPYIIA